MNPFDQQIKDKLKQPTPPPFDAWENIEKQLDEPEKKRRGIIWLWVGSVAASIAMIAGIYNLFQIDTNRFTSPTFVNKEPSKSSSEPIINAKSHSLTDDDEDQNKPFNKVKETSKFSSTPYVHTHKKSDSSNKEWNNNTSISISESKYPILSKDENLLNVVVWNDWDKKEIEPKETPITLQETTDFKTDPNLVSSSNKKTMENETIETNEKELMALTEESKKENSIDIKSIEAQSKLFVTSYFAPIKLMDEQSILSNNFNTHTIENEITYAYGAKIAYQITDNLRIRGGISKLAIDQRTSDVTTVSAAAPITSSVQSLTDGPSMDQHIRYTADKTILPNAENFPTAFYSGENNRLTYQLQFVEFPVELEYKLLKNNKFNLSAVAGGSYYVLTKNEIFLTSPSNQRETIGYATNVNNTSFSTNAALKFEYQINKTILFQVEPNYKLIMNQVKDVNQNTSSLFGVNVGIGFQLK